MNAIFSTPIGPLGVARPRDLEGITCAAPPWITALCYGGRIEIGPQYDRDDPFTARVRLHQSWYRADVLGLPFGERKGRNGARPLGSMLRKVEGDAGRNFLSSQIYDVVKRRIRHGGGVKVSRVLCNLLSSQPMCFNLFGPLVDDPELATKLAKSLWPSVARVTKVVIEWAPSPADEYLDDKTSFDAFIEYTRRDGGLGFCGIETKLTEPFSQDRYDKPAYRRWMDADAPWRTDAGDQVDHVDHNQLWRNHLLAWSLLRHVRSPYAEGRCVVVRHPRDARCERALSGYAGLLRDHATFEDLPLDRLVKTWRATVGQSGWLDEFELRYLALDRSEHLVSRAP